MSLTFEWDRKKHASNLRKHGISFEEAATAFGDPLSLTIPDPDHAIGEDRFILLGESSTGETSGCCPRGAGWGYPNHQRPSGDKKREKDL